jgi:hypothetical protein
LSSDIARGEKRSEERKTQEIFLKKKKNTANEKNKKKF